MCNPALAVGAALAIGGSALKAKQQGDANKSARRASDEIFERNQRKQLEMEGQRKALLDQGVDEHAPDQQIADVGREAAATERAYEAVQDDYGAARDAVPQSDGQGSQTVNNEYKRELATALAHYKQQGRAQAKLGAFGNNNLRLALDQRDRMNQGAVNANLAVSENESARYSAQQEYERKLAKGNKFGLGDILALSGTALGAGSSLFSLPTAAAAAAPQVINQFGAMPSAPAGTMFRMRAPAAPGIY